MKIVESGTLDRVQRAIVELLTPITDDPNCLGMQIVFAWRVENESMGVTGVEFPAAVPEAASMMAEMLREKMAGNLPPGQEYTPSRPKRN